MRTARRSTLQIFMLPALIAVATLIGLLAGLLGEGMPDLVAWLGLAVPLAAIGRAVARQPRRA